MRLLNARILASNAARQWHADSGKPRYIYTLWKEAWASLQQCNHKFEKSIISASVTNAAERQTTLMQVSFHAV